MAESHSTDAAIRSLVLSRAGTEHLPADIARWQAAIRPGESLLWVDITGHDGNTQPLLQQAFGFHHLAIEDALYQQHVPRIDDWDGYLYTVLADLSLEQETGDLAVEEVDVFIGPGYLVTLHDRPVDAVERVWREMAAGRPLRSLHAAHLAYLVIDSVTDSYMRMTDSLEDAIDSAEDEVFNGADDRTLGRLFALKHALLDMRRTLVPMRELLNRMARDELSQIPHETRVYFRDVYDHLVRLVDLNETLRDVVTGALDSYLSVISNRLNEVMKTLTVVTVLFAPLAFITGFFGMNFFGGTYEVPLGAGQHFLFAGALAAVVCTPLGILIWMKRRGWL